MAQGCKSSVSGGTREIFAVIRENILALWTQNVRGILLTTLRKK